VVQVGPHPYDPPIIGALARLRGQRPDYCRACYLTESAHPVGGWVEARPWGDTSPTRGPAGEYGPS
jgi:hypothetical protein